MRPSACAEQRVSSATGAQCKHLGAGVFHLSSRQGFGRNRVQCRQPASRTTQRGRGAAVTAHVHRRPQAPSDRPHNSRESLPTSLQTKPSFGIPWKPLLRALLLVPVLFLPAILLPRAAFSATAKPLDLPHRRTVEVWPCNHTPHQATASSTVDSTTSPSPISTTGVSHNIIDEHTFTHSDQGHVHSNEDHSHSSQDAAVIGSSRNAVVTQLDQIVAEHNTTQLFAAVALAILLLLALRSSQTKSAGAQLRSTARPTPVQPPTSPGRSSRPASPQRQANEDDDNDEYDDFEDYSQRPSSKGGLSVEQRRQQASKDIAAAKARQAAFESQGRSQFTDTDAVQPETPDFSEESTGPATATTILDDSKTPSSHRSSPEEADSSSSKQPDSSSATETFVPGESRPGRSASSSRPRQQTATEPDSFKPTYAQGSSTQPSTAARRPPTGDAQRSQSLSSEPAPSDVGKTQGARQKTVTASQKPVTQRTTLDRGPPSVASGPKSATDTHPASPATGPGKATGKSSPAEQGTRQEAMAGLQRKGKQPAASDREAATIFVDRPQDTDGASSQTGSEPGVQGQKGPALPPSGRAPGTEHQAREQAMKGLKKQSQQTQSVQPADPQLLQDTGNRRQQGKDQQPSLSPKPAATGFKPGSFASEQDQPKKQSDWRSDSNETSKLASSLSGASTPAESPTSEQKPRFPISQKEQPKLQSDWRSDKNQTSKLANSLASPTSAARPSADEQQSRSPPSDLEQPQLQTDWRSDKNQTSKLANSLASPTSAAQTPVSDPQAPSPPSKQDQQTPRPGKLSDKSQTSELATSLASSSTEAQPSVSDASRASRPSSPARAEQSPNRVRDFFSGVQSRLSGRSPTQSPGLGFASSSRTAAQTDLPSSPIQAQVPQRDVPAAEQMAAANKAQAAEQARQQRRGEITVRKYEPVDLPGSVDDFVKARGVRAPLLLLYGLAASAAQAIEPILPAKRQGDGKDRMLDVEAVNWGQLRKYDIFQQMLNAAASSPTAQEERFSPLRSLANAVPSEEGIPKYDFLRDLLRSAAQPRDPTASSTPLLASSSSSSGPDLSGLMPSLDPLAALLQDAKQPWRSADSKYDPFNALNRALATSDAPTGSTAALDPLGNLLRPDQARQGSSSPNQAARSKYDPFQAGWQSSKADAPVSPAAKQKRKGFKLRLPIRSKYDIFQQIFKAEGPSSDTASLDPLGQVLQSLRQPWDRPPRSKYDVFQAIFALQGPAQRQPKDPANAMQQGDASQPRESVKSKYDVFQALFSIDEPDAQRPALDPLSALQGNTAAQPAESVKSKYDPFQALFNLQGPEAQQRDMQQVSAQPTESVKSKYDPFHALFQSEGPSTDTSDLDPFRNFLQSLQRPRRAPSSKYDAFQALLKLQGPSREAPSFDPLGAAFRDGKQPWQAVKSKYDPFQALFQSQTPAGKADWDPLPHMIKAMTASSLLKKQQERQQKQQPIRSSSPLRSDKYNPVQQLLAVEPPTGRTPGFDPLGSLLKSNWVKDRRSRPQPAQPSRDAGSKGFGSPYLGARPGSPSKWASQTPVKDQKLASDLSGRALPGEHQARERAMANLQARAKGDDDSENDTSGRPSEWAGFVYNPYSGDLLPQEDDDDSVSSEGSQGGAERSGGDAAAGQGKAQFVSANPSARPVTRRQAIQDKTVRPS